jgi:hypothetical protein
VPDAELRYETFLWASLLGIGSCRRTYGMYFTSNGGTAFSRMFECIARDMHCDETGWAPRVSEKMCAEAVPRIFELQTEFGAGPILECLSKVLGAHVSAGGPVGALCAIVLCAAFRRVNVIAMGPKSVAYVHPMKKIANFMAVALSSLKQLHVFATALPAFVEPGICGCIGSDIAAQCVVDLVRGKQPQRAHELLTAVFALVGDDGGAFVRSTEGKLHDLLFHDEDWKIDIGDDTDDMHDTDDEEGEEGYDNRARPCRTCLYRYGRKRAVPRPDISSAAAVEWLDNTISQTYRSF